MNRRAKSNRTRKPRQSAVDRLLSAIDEAITAAARVRKARDDLYRSVRSDSPLRRKEVSREGK